MDDYKRFTTIGKQQLLRAYHQIITAKYMAEIFEEHRSDCKYVHATSRGHEVIQVATAWQLKAIDYCCPYYRDDALLMALGINPSLLLAQLLAKAEDPFSGGRTYYAHVSTQTSQLHPSVPPSLHLPTIPPQSSATGMQAIQAVGIAYALKYQSLNLPIPPQSLHPPIPPSLNPPIPQSLRPSIPQSPIVLCSMGDGAITEGEVAEAFQFAALKQLPVLFLVQDNDWGLSAKGEEVRTMNAYEYIIGFKGIERIQIEDGTDFEQVLKEMQEAVHFVRKKQKPLLVHVKVPLLGHHTSGVRKESYRPAEELREAMERNPVSRTRRKLLTKGVSDIELQNLEATVRQEIAIRFEEALELAEPAVDTLTNHIYAPTPITREEGIRRPAKRNPVFFIEALRKGMEEILTEYPEAIFYGQDIGARLGGVFRESVGLEQQFGARRVFNTAIQEALLVGASMGMAVAGLKPIVQIQFGDYFWPAMNQLIGELSKAYYLSNGKFPIQTLIRVPVGAYGGGGPYHSASIESTLLTIPGIKIVYPSNAADAKGLLKAAFLDPNPVIFLEHKGLYWAKVLGSSLSKTIEPQADYILPLGKANIVQEASQKALQTGESLTIITYGMGIHWALNAALHFPGQVEIVDLRTLQPLDTPTIFNSVKQHNKVIILSEEPTNNSFAESLAGKISQHCFEYLDAPVQVIGAVNIPAIPLNRSLEKAMLPNALKVAKAIKDLLAY